MSELDFVWNDFFLSSDDKPSDLERGEQSEFVREEFERVEGLRVENWVYITATAFIAMQASKPFRHSARLLLLCKWIKNPAIAD